MEDVTKYYEGAEQKSLEVYFDEGLEKIIIVNLLDKNVEFVFDENKYTSIEEFKCFNDNVQNYIDNHIKREINRILQNTVRYRTK